MDETGDRFYVRRTTGDLVGPLSKAAIAGLLRQGKLDGSEEVSPDRRTWHPLARLIPAAAASEEAPAPDAPPGDTGPTPAEGATWGERDLGGGGDLELAPLDAAFGQPYTPPEPAMAHNPEVASPPGLAPVDLETLAPLELEREESAPAPPSPSAVEPGAVAPDANEPAHAEPGSAQLPRLSQAPGRGPARAAAPASAGASTRPSTLDPGARSLDPTADQLVTEFETAPSTGLTVAPAPGGGEMVVTAGAPLAAGAAPLAGATVAAALRGRTLTAAKPRTEEPPKKSRRSLIIGGGAAILLVSALAVGFLYFDLGDLLIREPAAAKVLGDTAAEIASDRLPAYQRGATRLLEVVEAHPRSAALRAAAAELLASSVVLHRADRTRTARADAALGEIPPRPIRSDATAPTLARARTWIALAKGRAREAGRAMDESAALNDATPERQLLAGWVALGLNKASAAETIFQQGAVQFPTRVAFRYGLARAQEDGGRPQAAATYKGVLAASAGHFGAALGLIRTGGYAPAARLALANRLITDNAANATPAALAEAYAIVARAQAALGKSGEATATIDKALAKDPASPAALVAAGEALLSQGRLHEAVAKFSTALPSAPAVPAAVPAHELRFALAAVLIESGRRAEGLVLLGPPGPAREVSAADPRAAFWRGRAAELQTPPDLTAAMRAYEQTLAADPHFVPASLQLGALLLKQNRTAEAVTVLKRAQAAGVAPATLQVALGQAQLTAGDGERARKTFKDVLATSPKDAPARLGLASALEAAHDRTGARRELESLLADNPELPGLRPRLAELLVASGDREKALSLYQVEIDAGKASLAARLAAAKLAFEMGRKPMAQALLEKLTTEAPQTPGALLWLGKVRLSSGDVAGALADLRRALSFESTPELHFEHGRALTAAGNEEKALSEYEQAGTLSPAMVARGRILLGRGDTDHSVPILESAVKLAPDNGEGWLLLGNAYDRQGAPAKAVAAWRSAIRATPDNAEVHYHIGRWEMDQGQPGSAVVNLRQAAAKAPAGQKWLIDLYYQLGMAEKAKGSRAAAVTALKKYLSLAPTDAPSRHEVEQQLASLGAAP
jgi:tetratricopeptide (TPR) repeat protein